MVRGRGTNFTRDEINSFLDIVEDVLPLSSTQWERVAATHLARYPRKGRNVDSLKRKFKELYGKKIPTRDPNCLHAVCCEKQLRHKILELMDGSNLNSVNGMDKDGQHSGSSEDKDYDDQNQQDDEGEGVEDELELKMSLLLVWMHQWGNKQGDKCLGHPRDQGQLVNNHLVHPQELSQLVVHQGNKEGQLEDEGQLKDKEGRLCQLESKEGQLHLLPTIDAVLPPI